MLDSSQKPKSTIQSPKSATPNPNLLNAYDWTVFAADAQNGARAITDGDERTYTIGTYDIKCSGELITHPHLRVMSFRSTHYEKMALGFLRALMPEGSSIPTKENFPVEAVLMVYDAGKFGNADGGTLSEIFKLGVGGKMTYQKYQMYIYYAPKSIEALSGQLSHCR